MKNCAIRKDCHCDFECKYLDDSGECEPMGGECIGDLCDSWEECAACQRMEELKEWRGHMFID